MPGSHTSILVDVGPSQKDTLVRLASIGEDVEKLDANSDHVSGLVKLARNRERPFRQAADSMPCATSHAYW